MHSVNTLTPREVRIPVGDVWLYGARQGDQIAAVASRGGRPDLAGPVALALEQVAQLASSWFTTHLTSVQYTT